jgi:pantetheine-phosphate adenylyltransferase
MFLTPGERFMFVSATIVREISILGGDVSKFVSTHVAGCLQAKIKQMGGK